MLVGCAPGMHARGPRQTRFCHLAPGYGGRGPALHAVLADPWPVPGRGKGHCLMCAAAVQGKACGAQRKGRTPCEVGLPEICTCCRQHSVVMVYAADLLPILRARNSGKQGTGPSACIIRAGYYRSERAKASALAQTPTTPSQAALISGSLSWRPQTCMSKTRWQTSERAAARLQRAGTGNDMYS